MNRNFDLKFTGNTNLKGNIDFYEPSEMVKATIEEDGKIKFDFVLPIAADHYTVTLGELRTIENNIVTANNTFYSEKLKTSPYILDIEKERHKGMNTGASYSSTGIDPYYLMEPLYHTGDYAFYVTAYDKQGNIIFDTNGIYPSRNENIVHITGSEWGEADKLILEEKYDEAIKLYEAQLNDGRNGLHELKVLAKLFYNGWIYNKDTSKLEKSDSQKARKYLELLDEKIDDNMQIKSSLAGIYFNEGNYLKGIELLQKIPDPDGYTIYQIGQAYGYIGNLKKAEEYFLKATEGFNRVSDNLLMLYILQNKTERLEDSAQLFDESIYYADYKKSMDKYLEMDKSAYFEFFKSINSDEASMAEKLIENKNDDLALMYKGLLLLQKNIYKEREELYNGFYSKVKDPKIKLLMKYFGRARVQSNFGDE
jgi:hypothetical protein